MTDYIGFHVKKFESGSKGSLCLAQCGNDWGLSCGTYQLVLRWGNCIEFLKKYFPNESSKLYFNYNKADISTPQYPGSAYCSSPDEVKQVWISCYNKVGADKFFEYEHEYIQNNYYDKTISALKGIYQPTNRAMEECLWSWSVHKGSGGAVKYFKEILTENKITDAFSIDETRLFNLIYDKRYSINSFDRYSSKSSSERETLRPLLTHKTLNQYIIPDKGGNTMSNSSLVNCTVLSPNHSGKRTMSIDRITPHCVVGQLSAETIGHCFPSGRGASCNYGIGSDGRVCLIVDEANRSWCTSSNANDQRAITIECASDKTDPYAMTSAVYDKLILLCIDICKRYNKKKLLWYSDKNTALNYQPKSDEMLITVHRWYANKSCPGDWLFSRLGYVAKKVTEALSGTTVQTPIKEETSTNTLYRVQVGAYSKKENAVAQYNSIKKAGFDAIVVKVDNLYKVQVGAYSVKKNADNMLANIKKAGFDAFITTKGGTQVSVSTTTTAPTKTLSVGSKVKIKAGAKDLNSNTTFKSWVYNTVYDVISISGDKVVFGKGKAVTGVTSKSNIILQ